MTAVAKLPVRMSVPDFLAWIGAELLRRGAGGAWPERTHEMTGGTLDLSSIGFAVPLSQLYARTGLA
jgi:hypothetical protein